MSSFSRRRFLTAAALGSIGLGAACGDVRAQALARDKEGPFMKDWMDTWIKRETERGAVGTLHVSRFADPVYYLTKTIEWVPNPGQPHQAVKVPVGFVTDFASIPRIFWAALRPDGKYTYSAIVHDYLYWTQTRPREEADEIMKFGMEDFKVGSLELGAIYGAVRILGGFAWDSNAELRKKGERRILKKVPDSPTITWGEWKNTPGVF
jgi:hypothetical protein